VSSPARSRAEIRDPGSWSLRTRLVTWYCLSVLSVIATILVITWQVLDVRLQSSVEGQVMSSIDQITAGVEAGTLSSVAELSDHVESIVPRDGTVVALLVDGRLASAAPGAAGRLVADALETSGLTDEPDVSSGSVVIDGHEYHYAVTSPLDGTAVIVAADVTTEEDEIDHAVRVLGAVALVVTLAGGIMAWQTMGLALRPLRQTRDAALSIDEHDLSTRIEVRTRDEVGELGTAINHMLERIERAFQLRLSFEDHLGHEIRTPLAIIQGQLEVFPDDEEGRERSIQICRDEFAVINRDIESLLDLSEIRSPVPFQFKPIEVSTLAARAAKRARLANPGHAIDVEGADDVMVCCDEVRVLQAISNLVGNACGHSPAGSTVSIRTRVVGSQARFEVEDSGPGISLEDTEHVFEPFYRGPASTGRGLGLGLSIVKLIAEGHGGTAGIDQAAEGGALFWFTIDHLPAECIERSECCADRNGTPGSAGS
jgi:signal transduction histidine kinase